MSVMLIAESASDVFGSIGGAITGLADWLGEFSANWWFLGIILVIAYLDSMVPVVPSETMVIIGGVAAGAGNQFLPAVIAAAAIGAFLGDMSAYLVGARLSGWIERRAAQRPKLQRRLDWATHQIRARGGMLLVTARFIPGGRTALTVSSGLTRQPRPWFMGWIAVAVVIWATYASLLGYIGGKTFEDNHTKAFGLAFAIALLAIVVMEGGRHLFSRHSSDDETTDADEGTPVA